MTRAKTPYCFVAAASTALIFAFISPNLVAEPLKEVPIEEFDKDIEVPDDGNHYVVPSRNVDVRPRPHKNALVIDEISSSKRWTPEVLQVYSYGREERSVGDRIWWEIEHENERRYIGIFNSDILGPHIPTALPPERPIPVDGSPSNLLVTGVHPDTPNSAGGVDFSVGIYQSENEEPIKYVRFTVTPFNAVGDSVRGRIGGKDEQGLRMTGPIEPTGEESWSRWKNVFYNNTIVCAELVALEIEYLSDSSSVRIEQHELEDYLHPDFSNDCAYQP